MKMTKKFSVILATCGIAILMLMGTQVDAKAMSISMMMLPQAEVSYDSDLEKSDITVNDFRAWWSENKITTAYITAEHDLIYFGKTPRENGYGYKTYHIVSITEDDYNKMEKSDIEYSFSPIERVDENFLKENKDEKVTVTSEQDAIFFESKVDGTYKKYICTDFDQEYMYTLLEDNKVIETKESLKALVKIPLFSLVFVVAFLVVFLAAACRKD